MLSTFSRSAVLKDQGCVRNKVIERCVLATINKAKVMDVQFNMIVDGICCAYVRSQSAMGVYYIVVEVLESDCKWDLHMLVLIAHKGTSASNMGRPWSPTSLGNRYYKNPCSTPRLCNTCPARVRGIKSLSQYPIKVAMFVSVSVCEIGMGFGWV